MTRIILVILIGASLIFSGCASSHPVQTTSPSGEVLYLVQFEDGRRAFSASPDIYEPVHLNDSAMAQCRSDAGFSNICSAEDMGETSSSGLCARPDLSM